MLISVASLLLATREDGRWLAGSQAVPIALAGGLLAAAALVEIKRGRFLRPNRFPLRDPQTRERVWEGVAAVLRGASAPQLRTGTLLGSREPSAVPVLPGAPGRGPVSRR